MELEPGNRIGYIIYKTQYKMNMWAHCFKIKNFMIVTPAYYQYGAAHPWSQPFHRIITGSKTPFESSG